jgi:hypothetical protein
VHVGTIRRVTDAAELHTVIVGPATSSSEGG